jgi:hypothetical protein
MAGVRPLSDMAVYLAVEFKLTADILRRVILALDRQ